MLPTCSTQRLNEVELAVIVLQVFVCVLVITRNCKHCCHLVACIRHGQMKCSHNNLFKCTFARLNSCINEVKIMTFSHIHSRLRMILKSVKTAALPGLWSPLACRLEDALGAGLSPLRRQEAQRRAELLQEKLGWGAEAWPQQQVWVAGATRGARGRQASGEGEGPVG